MSLLFRAVVALRRLLYTAGILRQVRLPVPVIVAGNVAAGGTGKTPLTLWLADFLRGHGRAPGIVCRGYGGTQRAPQRVPREADPRTCGDEAVLLARRSGCEVWIGADRAAAARALLTAKPDCDVVISDDGLQHYRLARDIEICVVDAARGFGNGWLLPAGSLREPASRLATVDAVVLHGDGSGAPWLPVPKGAPCFAMKLEGREFRNLLNPGHHAGAEYFRGKRVHALAGIGHPQRFFRHLRDLGLEFTAHPFPDHHPYRPSEIAFANANAIVMTEKDAVKCQRFADESHWVLAVDAVPDGGLGDLILRKLGMMKGR